MEHAAGLGLELLLTDRLVDGRPVTATVDDLPADVPGPPRYQEQVVRGLFLRRPEWGVNTLPPWQPDALLSRVADVVRPDLPHLDHWRSEVVWLDRCHLTREGALALGRWMVGPQPTPDVAAVHRQLQRFLERGAVRVPVELPRTKVLARPAAAAWVAAGGTVHPWHG